MQSHLPFTLPRPLLWIKVYHHRLVHPRFHPIPNLLRRPPDQVFRRLYQFRVLLALRPLKNLPDQWHRLFPPVRYHPMSPRLFLRQNRVKARDQVFHLQADQAPPWFQVVRCRYFPVGALFQLLYLAQCLRLSLPQRDLVSA